MRDRHHLERARPLAGKATARRPWARGIRARLGRAADGLALQLMTRAFAAGDDKRAASSVTHAWRELSVGPAVPTASLYPLPPMPRVTRTVKSDLPGGSIDDLAFPSYYAPDRPAAMNLLRRYPHNATACLRHYRHHRPGHPAVMCLPGWGGGRYPVEAKLFNARALYDLGLDVYLYVHPYHQARSADGLGLGATHHPSSDIERTNEAFLQTVWEVRAVLRDHQHRTGQVGGVIGMSLGGYVTALLASVAPEIAFAVPMLPIADLTALVWSHASGPPATDTRFDEMCRAMAIHSPLAHHLVIAKQRTLIIAGRDDCIVPPRHAEALWEHWDRPRMHWFPGSHLLHFGREAYLGQLHDLLVALGIVA